MITYKYKIQNKLDIALISKQYNSVVRFAYNRFQEDDELTQSQVEKIVKEKMNNINHLDASLIKCAVTKAKSIEKNNAIFGGKNNFNKLKYKKKNFTKEEWIDKRNDTPIQLRGSSSDPKGNRKATLDIINNNQIILKLDRKNHHIIQLPHLNNNHRKQLSRLEQLCSENKACFTLEINSEYVYIVFDEKFIEKQPYETKTNRYMTFDLNPNYIGFIIADENNVIHKEIVEMKKLNLKNIKNNKRKHEILEISKYLTEKAKHFHVENVCFEKLNISSKENQKGKGFNRLVNNYWMRNIIINNIKKRCNIIGIKTIEVLPQYSSFIGQMNNPEDVDSIASAIELNRRAVLFDKIYVKKELPKQEILYPKFDIGSLATHWKEMLKNTSNNIRNWKELYSCFKKSKTSYRFLFDLNKIQVNSFRLFSTQSLVLAHICV